MNRRIRTTAVALVTGLLLAGCSAAASPSPSPSGGPSLVPSAPSLTAEPTASPSPTPAPTAEPTASPTTEPTATPQPPTGVGFTITSHPEADALFLDRDDCQNLRDGYQLVFPDDWYTNTEIRDVPPCSWFSPGFYTVDDGDDLPDEIAIEIFWLDGVYGYLEEPISRDEGMIAGQSAFRIETGGTSEDPAGGGTMYEYVVQLGPPGEESPILVARTDTDMGGEYELNKAVLDRIMATMEFIGSTQ
jgi:hypothetical protein